ncbi:hypothetical protein MYOV003v1_p0022 [Vibrio phage 207E48.1]|nr:hypothetical protein MYOV003v1_p0022 [Vibrio phage 207E48.1]
MNLLKKFARWVLSDELDKLKKDLKSECGLSHTLATYLLPYQPEMVDGGETDNTPILQMRLDIARGLKKPVPMPTGRFNIGAPIIVSSDTTFGAYDD